MKDSSTAGTTNGYTRSSTYKAAAQMLKKRGWTRKHPRGPKGEYNISTAIKASMAYDESFIDYFADFCNKLGMGPDIWENNPNVTKQDAIKLLRSM